MKPGSQPIPYTSVHSRTPLLDNVCLHLQSPNDEWALTQAEAQQLISELNERTDIEVRMHRSTGRGQAWRGQAWIVSLAAVPTVGTN